jgi:hypothetical protein
MEFHHNLNLLQIKEVEIEGMIEYLLEYVSKSCMRPTRVIVGSIILEYIYIYIYIYILKRSMIV